MDVKSMTPAWHAKRTPDAAAIIMGMTGEVVSYSQLEERSRSFASALRSKGLKEGGHVAILMENTRSYLEVAWAAQRSGAYYTAINSHLKRAEVQYILEDCEATVLVASEAMADVVAELDLSRVGVRISGSGHLEGFEDYEELIRRHQPEPLDRDREGREMLYSSGTTGRPKGVQKSLPLTTMGDPSAQPVQVAEGIVAAGGRPGAVYLSPAPLYHSAPLVYSMSMLRTGAAVVVMERFDPALCLQLIEQLRVTHAQFVPTMFTRLLRLPKEVRDKFDPSSLEYVVHAAAPCPVSIKRQMIDWWGPIIYEYYAATEDIGGTFITSEEWLSHPGSVGRPRNECHIVGPDGAELGPGQSGVVYFSGGRGSAYHNDPDKTASMSNEQGWRTVGDIGFLDEDGYLYLTDRQAHMIISGGVNIYPQEAENVLAGHPAVADVAVIGVPDDEMGEAAKAVVELAEGFDAGAALEAELLDYCRAELATYKCPRSVDFVEALPRDPNGKLYKRILREQYWEGHRSLVI